MGINHPIGINHPVGKERCARCVVTLTPRELNDGVKASTEKQSKLDEKIWD